MDQSISIGFRSGLSRAQSSTLSFNFPIFSFTIFDVYHDARSCCKKILGFFRNLCHSCHQLMLEHITVQISIHIFNVDLDPSLRQESMILYNLMICPCSPSQEPPKSLFYYLQQVRLCEWVNRCITGWTAEVNDPWSSTYPPAGPVESNPWKYRSRFV